MRISWRQSLFHSNWLAQYLYSLKFYFVRGTCNRENVNLMLYLNEGTGYIIHLFGEAIGLLLLLQLPVI